MKQETSKPRSPAWLAAVAVLFTAAGALAQEAAPRLKLNMTAQKEVTVEQENGTRIVKLVPATETKTDDVIVYTITYANESAQPVHNAALVGPIPSQTTYVLDSASEIEEASLLFSINGGKTFVSPPITYKSRKPDGTEEEKPAPAKMYTHVKWRFSEAVKPGAEGIVKYKVRVK